MRERTGGEKEAQGAAGREVAGSQGVAAQKTAETRAEKVLQNVTEIKTPSLYRLWKTSVRPVEKSRRKGGENVAGGGGVPIREVSNL